MTVVGDVDQLAAPWGARRWSDVLTALVGDRWRVRELTVNYRTPSEIMAVAGDVLAAVDPMATVPTSVRDAGTWPLAHRATPSSLVRRVTDVVADARVAAGEGRVAVIVATGLLPDVETALREAFAGEVGTGAAGLDRAICVATVAEVKGLEFDAVVVVEPSSWTAGGPRGLRELYVALTRATQRLDVVHTGDLPGLLSRMARANESDAAVSETADDEARAV
jgi:DNA helicase IV